MKRSTSCLFCSDIGDAPAVDDDDQSARSQRASRASGPMRGATTAVLSIVFSISAFNWPANIFASCGSSGRLTASHIGAIRSEEHTSELQSLMRISYAVFCLKKKNKQQTQKYRP